METDGTYPTEASLERIKAWPHTDWRGLLDFIQPYWADNPGYGSWRQTRRSLRLATGGWSGNEDIISALNHTMFWGLTWQSSHRGGLFIFDLTVMHRVAS